jgi:hypothetical protein
MKRTAIKKYTVNTKTVVQDNKTFKVFDSLPKARTFAGEQLRSDNFVSLLNFKRIPLSI